LLIIGSASNLALVLIASGCQRPPANEPNPNDPEIRVQELVLSPSALSGMTPAVINADENLPCGHKFTLVVPIRNNEAASQIMLLVLRCTRLKRGKEVTVCTSSTIVKHVNGTSEARFSVSPLSETGAVSLQLFERGKIMAKGAATVAENRGQ
jgi:hypothetical protein